MKIGSTALTNCKLGSTQIAKVYIGSTLVWENIDADAAAFLTAAGITNATITSAIDTLVKDLKAYNIWTKIIAYHPFVGGTAATHKWNLKDPRDLDAAYRLKFYGGLTHDANGLTGNDSNGYADTLFSEASVYDNLGFFVYSRTATQSGDYVLGDTGGVVLRFIIVNTLDLFSLRHYANSSNSFANTNGSKFAGINRRGGTTVDAQYETTINTFAIGVTATTNNVCYLRGGTLYSPYNIAAGIITRGMTQADCLNLRLANLAFQTALSRNV